MSGEIKQVLGFDASQAIAELNKLNNTLGQTNQAFAQLAQATGKFNGINAAKAMQSLGSSSANTARQVAQVRSEADRMAISFGLFKRIIFTQSVVSQFRLLRTAIADATKDAVEFQNKIALIRTIDDSGASFDKVAQSVRNLSDALNTDLGDTAEAVFQSISNQVGDFETSLDFTKTAGKFAKATGSSMASAVDALSGILKSYNLDVSEADRVSSILFRTIDLGRVSADSLANSLGRVGPIANALGVPLEEMAATIASISVKGSNTPETLTQLRAIMSALLKPSEAMSKALETLGFDSGKAAIDTLGLAGTLEALDKATGGSTAQMAALFPNVRALAGFTSLNSNFRELAKAIREMQEAGRNLTNQKFLDVRQTDAEKITQEINKLKNALTVDLGQAALKAGVELSKLVGGAGNVVGALTAIAPGAAGAVAAFAALRTAGLAADAGLIGLSKTLGIVGAGLAAIAATKAAVNVLNEVSKNRALAPGQEAAEHNSKVLASFQENQKKQLETARQTDEAVAKSLKQRVQELNRLYILDLANAKDAAGKKAALDKFAGGLLKDVGVRSVSQEDAIRQINAGVTGRAKEREAAVKVDTQKAQITAIDSETRALLGAIDERSALRNKLLEGDGAARAAFEGVAGQVEALNNKLTVTKSEYDDVAASVLKLAEANKTAGTQTQAALTPELQALNAALANIKKEADLTAALEGGVKGSAAIAANFERAAKAAGDTAARAATIGAATQNKAMGGILYRAAGGMARGSDQIHAMLSAGETVVDARNSRKFFSQIQSIRAGVPPVYRHDGGVTNNTTNIGDINLNLPKGTNNGVAIAQELRRTIRRQFNGPLGIY